MRTTAVGGTESALRRDVLARSERLDVTVVVSTHNRAPHLRRLLTALLCGQNAPNIAYEVVLVDNNSSDDTRRILESWCQRFPDRLTVVFEPRQGVSYGRNAGVAAARATLIAFTDDDNEPSEDWVAAAVRLFRDNPELELCGGKVLPQWSGPVPPWLDRRHWAPLAIMDYGDEPFWTSIERPICLLTANLVARREVFDRVGGFSPQFPRSQDHEWLLRFWDGGGRALYTPELVVNTPVMPERLTRRYHRAWHRQHGRAASRMRLQERISSEGHLVPERASAMLIGGAPPFVYRELAVTVGSWIRACGSRDWSGAFEASNHIRYLRGYLAERAGADASLTRWVADAARWVLSRSGTRARIDSSGPPADERPAKKLSCAVQAQKIDGR